jgi:peptidoglycan/LPS O-acetylase OafA/YrhL
MASAPTRTRPRRPAPAPPPEPAPRARAPQPGGDDRRNAGVDGLRALAALSVFAFHIYLYGRQSQATEAWEQIPLRFSIGLILFFVVSGYLLYGGFARAARRQQSTVDSRSYLKRRAARILPAYYVCLLAVYPLLVSIEPTRGVKIPETGDLWLFAVMGQNFSLDTLLKLNPVIWTLQVELAFYVLLPLLGLFAFHVARGRLAPQVWMAVCLIVFGIAWNVFTLLADLPQTWQKQLPAYLPYFAFGILAALFMDRRAARGTGDLPVRATALLVIAGAALIVGESWWRATTSGSFERDLLVVVHNTPAGVGFGLMAVAVAGGTGRWAGWARVRPLAWLGLISYGIYLWHLPVILYLKHLGLEGQGYLPLVAAALPVTVALGAASWYLVERPLIDRAHGRRRRRPQSAPATA